MRILQPDFDLPGFFNRLAHARKRALLLDYDGTLAPFQVDPGKSALYPGVRKVLERVIAVPGTRLAIVTGRRFEDIRGPLETLPHTEAWASHGWERISSDGAVHRNVPNLGVREALARADSAIHPLIAPGIRLEAKVASRALHWRGVPEDEAARVHAAAIEAWQGLDDEHLALMPFEKGIEIRARGHDKGDAVRSALEYCDEGACAYFGDDFTDEDGFRAIRPYGLGVLVGERLRETQAHVWVKPPEELIELLEPWAAA